jgi:asparagine synthase (glutamine-hydrolysing)
MPGIAGIVGRGTRGENEPALTLMVKCMMHEPFYVSGTYINEDLGLWIGWANHEGSFADCLPIWNEEKDICLLFSGENFSDKPEIDELKTRRHTFVAENASYLVHLYEEQGCGFLEKLNGWFSGLLVDVQRQKIVLFNDRYGINRIYYHEDANVFYFSSEAKSLLKVLPKLRELDRRSVGEFLSCSAVLQNRTLFSGISLLPGGSAWVFTAGRCIKKKAYFKAAAWDNQPRLNASDYYERLKEIWARVLPRYVRGRQGVGLSLTGGVDSRMILAWASCLPGTLPCYTWANKYRVCADVKIARQTARICHQPHTTILVGDDFLSKFPTLAERAVYMSDGAMDVSGSVDLYVQRLARQVAPVRLSGVYGGEILRHLVMFEPTSINEAVFDAELVRSFEEAEVTYASELQGHLSFTAFKQAPWYAAGKLGLERSQVTLRTPYFDNDLVALAYQAPTALLNNQPALRLISDGNPRLARIGTDRGIALRSIPGVTQALHQYQEFTFKAEYAYDLGMPQWLARLDSIVARLHLERLFLGRHRVPFFRVWYRDELSKYVKEVLLDPATLARPYLRTNALEQMLKGHLNGTRNYTSEIHKVLTLELIQRKLIELN